MFPWAGDELLQGLAHFLTVVERVDGPRDLLAGLVTLADDRDGAARPGSEGCRHGLLDRRGATAPRRAARPRGPPPGPRRGAPARIAAGSSDRGLSSVTKTMSAFSAAAPAHRAPACPGRGLPRRRGRPPADPGAGAQGGQRGRHRLGGVGVVDDDARQVLAAVDGSPAPSGPARAGRRRRRARAWSAGMPSASSASAASAVLTRLKSPGRAERRARRRRAVAEGERRVVCLVRGQPPVGAARRAGSERGDRDGRQPGQLLSPLVVDADHAAAGPLWREQRGLGQRSSRPCPRGSRGGPGRGS